jgi:S1-C subfamily serine protease
MRRFFATSFGSGVAGGLVVLIAGVVLIEAGVVDTDDGSPSSSAVVAPAALARPASSSTKGLTVNQIYERDAQGVAFIKADVVQQSQSMFGLPQQQQTTATGSGFLIDDDGHIFTNAHVVQGAKNVEVQLGKGDSQSAEIVGTDPSSDIALLKVDNTEGVDPLPLGESDSVQVGDPVVAIGNPFGLDRTVTSGIVSALQRQIQAPNGFSINHVIQTDAAINPGNSGGPLINAAGEVIGINSQIATGGGGNGNVGIGFAIPIDTIRAEIQQLETKGEVEHAFLGITGGTVTPELAKAVNLPVTEGVIVQTVVKGSPADKAGLEAGHTSATIGGVEVRLGGDIITEANGKKVKSMEELVETIQDSKPGDDLELTILRDGQEKTADVTLGTQPDKAGG